MSLRSSLSDAGFGRLAYRLWFQPVGRVKGMLAAGGPLEVRRTESARREMETAARSLSSLPSAQQDPLELHVLTGSRFWYQTAFCLWTFAKHSGRRLRPILYDDGTLAKEHILALQRLFPAARVYSTDELASRIDHCLPLTRFPYLRERRDHYPNIRKLLDVHAGQTGWKLVLDSDLLFFRQPCLLVQWLTAPAKPLHAVDCQTSYGYPTSLLRELAVAPVAERVNAGIAGLESGALDWDKLEFWCRTLVERNGTHYFLEQALLAMLLAGRDCAVAPSADYITRPDALQARDCRAVMHHYVAESKRWYFRHCWRVALRA